MDRIVSTCLCVFISILGSVSSFEKCHVNVDKTYTYCESGYYCCLNTKCCREGYSSYSSTSSSSSGLSGGTIAVIVVGCIAFIFIIIAICNIVKNKGNNAVNNI